MIIIRIIFGVKQVKICMKIIRHSYVLFADSRIAIGMTDGDAYHALHRHTAFYPI